ncbi:leukocyte cell-derived chemotaxin-2-like isoform X2 [Oculina patagonica]
MKLSFVIAIVLGIIYSQEVLGCGGGSRRRRGGGGGGEGGGRGGGSSSKCFAQICSSNPSNQIRGRDNYGSGAYGASRDGGRRSHKGIDIVCTAGSYVYAPFPAKVRRVSKPYGRTHKHWGKDFNTGIYMEGTGSWQDYKVKMWYVSKDVSDGTYVSAGSVIGTMKDRAAASPGMTNHVHVQLYKDGSIVDPTPYVC